MARSCATIWMRPTRLSLLSSRAVLGQDPGRSYLRTLGAMRLPPNLLGGAAGGAFTEAQGEQCAGVGCGH